MDDYSASSEDNLERGRCRGDAVNPGLLHGFSGDLLNLELVHHTDDEMVEGHPTKGLAKTLPSPNSKGNNLKYSEEKT